MEQITHVNATAANLLTNFTPMNTIVPGWREKRINENGMYGEYTANLALGTNARC